MSKGWEYIKYDSKNDFIVLKTIPVATSKAMIDAYIKCMEISRNTNCKKVFIDAERTIKLPSIVRIHTVASFIAKQASKLSSMRIAMAINDDLIEEYRFLDNVLTNRAVKFHIFHNSDDAKNWLTKEE